MNRNDSRMKKVSQPMITLYDTPAHVPQPWAPNAWRVRYVSKLLAMQLEITTDMIYAIDLVRLNGRTNIFRQLTVFSSS